MPTFNWNQKGGKVLLSNVSLEHDIIGIEELCVSWLTADEQIVHLKGSFVAGSTVAVRS